MTDQDSVTSCATWPTLERKFRKFTRYSLRGTDFTGEFSLNNFLWPFVILTVSLFTRDA